ncbi:hypothetical protein MA16_Dca011042 [Dendrobium catenatum]|uniref:Uncharacterized protein n=1 Tax=Dendrobium catenatum TaxID=906689 RepID=A0A2I0WCJ0_9ASPA|nr:hypothetical protein MA16_Dca011042 [Dendrobium catenatum]
MSVISRRSSVLADSGDPRRSSNGGGDNLAKSFPAFGDSDSAILKMRKGGSLVICEGGLRPHMKSEIVISKGKEVLMENKSYSQKPISNVCVENVKLRNQDSSVVMVRNSDILNANAVDNGFMTDKIFSGIKMVNNKEVKQENQEEVLSFANVIEEKTLLNNTEEDLISVRDCHDGVLNSGRGIKNSVVLPKPTTALIGVSVLAGMSSSNAWGKASSPTQGKSRGFFDLDGDGSSNSPSHSFKYILSGNLMQEFSPLWFLFETSWAVDCFFFCLVKSLFLLLALEVLLYGHHFSFSVEFFSDYWWVDAALCYSDKLLVELELSWYYGKFVLNEIYLLFLFWVLSTHSPSYFLGLSCNL